MLDQLRKKQKVIVYIVAAAFILSLGAGGIFGGQRLLDFLKGSYLGKVNGVKLDHKEYAERIQNYVDMYRQNDQEVDEQMMEQIKASVWNEMVAEVIWNQQIKKHKIKVSDAEIKQAMENDIPQFIQENASFQTNGVFDRQLYYAALNNKQDTSFKMQIYEYMKEYLPRKKLQQKIMRESGITADSLKTEFYKETDSVTGKAIWFDYNMADSVYVSDAEVRKYYDDNKDKEFKKGPASRLKYVSFPLQPSEEDFADIKLEIDGIYDRVTRGREDFATLAMDYSEDEGSGKQGGALGRFGRNQMVPEFDQVAFSLPLGKVSEPFRTQFGWHIVRVDSIFSTTPGAEEIFARHILFKVETSEATRVDLEEKAKEAQKLIKKNGIDKAAQALKLEVKTSRWLAHDSRSMEGFGEHGGLYQFMKDQKAGKVSEVFFLRNNQEKYYMVAEMKENVESYYEDFAEKKLQIKFDLEKKKKIANVKTKAQAFIARVPRENYLNAAAADGWKVIDLTDHKAETRLGPPVNAQLDDLNKAALALEAGAYSGLIDTKEGPFVIYAASRVKPDMTKFDTAKQTELRTRLEEAAFNRWFQQLIEDAEIIDNRYKYGY